jgi:hypothetical protein
VTRVFSGKTGKAIRRSLFVCVNLIVSLILPTPPLAQRVLGVLAGLHLSGRAAAPATSELVELLGNPELDRNDFRTTCQTLAAIGPAAKIALPKLNESTEHHSPWLAYVAAEAIKAIEGR